MAGAYGDTAGLRASVAGLRRLAGDFAGFGKAFPSSIPTTAWSGPAATHWSSAFPELRGHFHTVGVALESAADVFDRLAFAIDNANAQQTAAPADAVFLDVGLTEQAAQVNAAKARAASELLAIAQHAKLSQIGLASVMGRESTQGLNWLDKSGMVADGIGVFDPTPISDGVGMVLSLFNGDFVGAGLSLVSIIPYVGDAAAKGSKGARYASKFDKGLDVAEDARDAGRAISALRHADQLSRIDLKYLFTRIPNHTYKSAGYEFATDAAGRTILARGRLKLEATPRSLLSTKIGHLGLADDQGGHLIGLRFNGPDHPLNLVPQNGNLNQVAYKRMEDEWQSLLKSGRRVDVTVHTLYDSASSVRPSLFQVEWTVDGSSKYTKVFQNQ